MMESHQECLSKSRKAISVADHMLTMTYPLVNDPKLLVSVVDNIFIGMDYAMSAILAFDRLYKRIPPYGESFESRLNTFKLHVVDRYKIDRTYLKMISDLQELLHSRQESPVSFSRKDRYVICSDDYSMKTLSVDALKNSLEKAKLFIQKTSLILDNNERSLGRR